MPASSRPQRKTFIGFVTSRMGDKSVKVTVSYRTPHARYQKVVNRQTVVHAHDAKNETKVGDQVEVMETRPLSRLKRWRVLRVIAAAQSAVAQAISEQDVAEAVPTKLAPAAPAPAAVEPAPTDAPTA